MREEWNTWKHLNQPVRFFGLSGSQLGMSILLVLIMMAVNFYVALVAVVLEFLIIGRISAMQKKGDMFPIRTRRVKSSSPDLIQDLDGFYDMLLKKDSEEFI